MRLLGTMMISISVGVLGIAVPSAYAQAPSSGCPSGFALFAVDTPGYRVAAVVDSPTNTYGIGHQPGNGDGWVCAREIGKADPVTGGVLYEFVDNTLPSPR